jgi:hypothetical protein
MLCAFVIGPITAKKVGDKKSVNFSYEYVQPIPQSIAFTNHSLVQWYETLFAH